MSASGLLAKRYATAYFSLAQAAGGVPAWREDLQAACQLFAHAEIQGVIKNPAVPRSIREQIVDDLSKEFLPATRNLLRLLVTNQRLEVLPDLLVAYDQLADRAAGRLRAMVTAATHLDDNEQREIAAALAKRYGAAVEVTTHQDPEILGGLIVKIGDRVIDASVKTRLEQLRTALV